MGWLRGSAAAAGSYALHALLLLLPVLAANGPAAVGSYVLRALQLLQQLPTLVAGGAVAAAPHVQHVLLELSALVAAWVQAAGFCALHVLQQLSALAVYGLRLACGAALVLALVSLSRDRDRFRVRLEWCRYVESRWERFQAGAWAYIMRERRWLALWKAFVRNRKRLKYTILALRLVSLIRLTYVFMEDVFFTCYWFFLIFDDYARDLVEDFYLYYDDYYLENDNVGFVAWYWFHIFKEQALYHQVARQAADPKRPQSQRRWGARWGAYLHGLRRAYLGHYSRVAIWLDAFRDAAGPRR